MNPRVIEIADAIARWEEISPEDFKFIKAYIFTCNKFKCWEADDVLSNFLLDIKNHYNPEFDFKQKEIWLYAHIKKAISDMSRFDRHWTLYNPVPVVVDNDLVVSVNPGIDTPNKAFEYAEWERLIESLKEIIRDGFEMDIYVYCIIWDTPISSVATSRWKSPERWRVTKEKVLWKLKLYIENYR